MPASAAPRPLPFGPVVHAPAHPLPRPAGYTVFALRLPAPDASPEDADLAAQLCRCGDEASARVLADGYSLRPALLPIPHATAVVVNDPAGAVVHRAPVAG